MKIFIAVCLVVSLFLATETNAQVYKYVDKEGNVHFTNTPTSTEDQRPTRFLPDHSRSSGIHGDQKEKCPYPKAKGKIFNSSTGASEKMYDPEELEAYHACREKHGIK